MTKRKPIEIKYTEPVKHPEALPSRHSLCLVAGDWWRWLGRVQLQLIVTEALNHCVYHEKLHIEGYLITQRAVYLVLHTHKIGPHHLPDVFFERVEKQIENYLDQIRGHHPGHIIRAKPLFRLYNLDNFNLIKLITGQGVQLPYYSAALEKLKDLVNRSEFCSAIDYSGANGPVVVRVHGNYHENVFI
ncbi:hypothetical protein [Mucilaginibacter celer]|uniref:Uncharacterized protein n=1 Tax=Mucilaginibacter celer TaxID=2305508 RepID=A0A494W6A3_9SPHI|nr:hypothetical protein [Mucilaginibacter celer]AYL99045.1 hypothetical protein HYN43_028895 [Mucilaginibacter celer]